MNRLYAWAQRHNITGLALAELTRLYDPPVLADNGGTEAGLQSRLRLLAPIAYGGQLWRNNRGAMTDDTGRTVRFGLGNDSKKISDVWKSGDLVGITPVQHAGLIFGVCTMVEVKKPGWNGPKDDHEKAQANALRTIEGRYGIATFAQDEADYHNAVARFKAPCRP